MASLREFQSGTCSQSIGVSFEGVPKRLSNHSGFRAWTKWHASQTHERMDRVARRKMCLRFRWMDLFGGNSWEKEVEGLQFDAV